MLDWRILVQMFDDAAKRTVGILACIPETYLEGLVLLRVTQRLWLIICCVLCISQVCFHSADVISKSLFKTTADRRLMRPVRERKATRNDARIITELFQQLLTQHPHL